MIGAEIPQRLVELVEERLARRVSDDFPTAEDEPRLAGQDDVGPNAEFAQKCTQNGFGAAVAVDRSGVDQRPAGVEEGAELLLGIDLVDRRAEAHRPEPEPRHLKT